MRQDTQLSNFTKGELSPRIKGRTDFEGYYDGLDTCFNMVVLPQGGATRRPGTLCVALAKDQGNAIGRARLIPFVFSVVQPYMLEVFAGGIRVYANDGQVLNGPTPVEIDTYNALGLPLAVTGTANSGGLVALTVNATASLTNGESVAVSGVLGTTEANGTWPVTIVDGTHVTLTGSTYANAYVSGGAATPLIPTALPYTAADLPCLQYTQSADTLYICGGRCPGNSGLGYPTIQLTRSSNTDWAAQQIAFRDGPYLPAPVNGNTITPSAASGAITLTAASTLGINATPSNPGQGFLASDVGRALRLQSIASAGGTAWVWVILTAVNSPTSATAVVMPAVNGGAIAILAGTVPVTNWQLGKWSQTTGYPYVPMFWQQRLNLDGTNNQPNAVEASFSADFTNLAPTAQDDTVADDNALDWVISDDQVNDIRWIAPAGSAAAMQLGIGTSGSEFILQPATTSAVLSDTNVQVYRETSYGSAPNVRPLRIGKALLFADRPGRKVREWQWAWAVNGYLGPDITVDAEHITRSVPAALPGIVEMAYQQSPYGVVWCRRGDGQLIGNTYLPDQQIRAWHRHQLGGQYYGGPPVIESIATIPSPDGSYDELWMIVLRTVAGVPTRTVEVMTRYFDGLAQEQAFFVDAGITSPLTYPAATLTPPASLTNAAPVTTVPAQFGGYAAGAAQSGLFTASAPVWNAGSVGDVIRINGGTAVITHVNGTQNVSAQVLNALYSLAPAAATAWSCTAPETVFSGAAYLDGETVQVLGDGADYGTQVVAGGDVTLPNGGTASLVTMGLPIWSELVGMPWVPQGAAAQASQGRVKSIDHLFLRFYESLGCNFGMRRTDPTTFQVDDRTEPLETRAANDLAGLPPPLFTGILKLPKPGGFDVEQQVVVQTNGPLPLTVVSIGLRGDIGDLGVAA
jgi:hypothetical protein